MIVQVQFKDPNKSVNVIRFDVNETDDDVMDALSKWFKYGEYVTVRIDTATGETSVLKHEDV